ncbi:MAG: type II toxin-antitoxin system RelE/ParE family toxin [Planctomycetales bacterium]
MDYEVVWTEPAMADLRAISDYIAERNPAAAVRTIAAILERVDLLQRVPFMGPIYPRGSQGRVREIVSGKYRIFYRVIEDSSRVEILTVWHGARREPTLPE